MIRNSGDNWKFLQRWRNTMFTTNVKSSMHLSEKLCYCGVIYFKLSYGIVTVLLLNSDELMPMDWFLYDNGLRHERVNIFFIFVKLKFVWYSCTWTMCLNHSKNCTGTSQRVKAYINFAVFSQIIN